MTTAPREPLREVKTSEHRLGGEPLLPSPGQAAIVESRSSRMSPTIVRTRDPRLTARRSLMTFVVALVLFTAIIESIIARAGGSLEHISALYVAALMWSPFAASLVARLVWSEGFGDVSFRWGGRIGWKAIGLAVLYPILVGGMAYGIAFSAGLAGFNPPDAAKFPWMPSPAGRFFVQLVLNGAIGTVFGALFAAGEELGWRGYLLIRMRDACIPRPVLLGGIAWGLWHVPLIVTGQYTVGANIAVAVPVFCLAVIVDAYLFALLRLRSGSVWPAVFAHSAWNAIIQGVFDRSTAEKTVWVGEAGILTLVAQILVVAWLIRKPFAPRRSPRVETGPEISLFSL